MKRAFLAALAFAVTGVACAERRHEASVVALSVSYQTYDEDRPWAKNGPGVRASSAVVLEDSLLLTRAAAIASATLIHAEKLGDADPRVARVVHVDPEIDLALVTVDAPGFFDDLAPVRIADSVPREGIVQSLRWNNRQLEISTSRVSRIEVARSRYGNIEHAVLIARTDLTDGGQSEPVFSGAELVGLTSSQSEQRAVVIPAEILRAYIDRVRNETDYRGFAVLGASWQYNQDPSLAEYLGLRGEPRGVVILGVWPGGSSCGVLRPRDVLLSLGGHAIDAVGNYRHPRYGRLRFSHLITAEYGPGDTLLARVLRDGSEIDVPIELRRYPSSLRLIAWRRDYEAPPYLVAGGLVFRELDGAYLRTWGEKWRDQAPVRLVTRIYLESHGQGPDRRRIVLLSSILPDSYNLGYHDLSDRFVERVNGRVADSIADVAEAFEHPDGGFHVVTLEPNDERHDLVLDAATFSAASKRILETYSVLDSVRLGPPLEARPEFDCGADD